MDFWEYGETVINPITIIYLVIAVFLQLSIHKDKLVIPIIVSAAIIPVMQRIVIADIDFTVVRILLIATVFRIILKKEFKSFRLRKIDKVVLLYSIVSSLIYIIQWRTFGALVNRFAHILETFGVYILFRMVIQDKKQIYQIMRAMAITGVILAFFMVIEQLTGRNLFFVFGGVEEFTPVREGKFRSQGAFSHPILAGVYGALMIPMMWGVLSSEFGKKSYWMPSMGMAAGFIIMATSNSSTPYIAFLASAFGIFVWHTRKYIPEMKVLFIIMVIALQLAMDSPIWFLMAKIDFVGGSTGYFRSFLFDQFVRRFGSWFLLGVRTTAYWGWGLQDLTNQYVLEGVRGGILSLILFISIFVMSFRSITSVSKDLRQYQIKDFPYRFLFSQGIILFATCVVFMAVSYFGNMNIFLYLVIATIACLRDMLTRETNESKESSPIRLNEPIDDIIKT